MKLKLKRIRNNTGSKPYVTHRGVRIELTQHGEELFDEVIADKFLEAYPGVVVEAEEDFGTVAQATPEPKKIWVANVTGDPDAPDNIMVRQWIKKAWTTVPIENTAKHAVALREWAEGPMVEYTARDGTLEALNMPGHYVTIPAYKRVEMEAHIANWFMDRTIMSAPKVTGGKRPVKAIFSRKPSQFEPDSSWELDEIVDYLCLVDPDAPEQKGEDELQENYKKAKLTEEEVDVRLGEAKREVLRRLYFRLVNPEFRLPTRKEFKAFQKTREIEAGA
jgi:hypothetical protein